MGRTEGGADGGPLFGGNVRVSMRQPRRGVVHTVADFKKEIQLERDVWEL